MIISVMAVVIRIPRIIVTIILIILILLLQIIMNTIKNNDFNNNDNSIILYHYDIMFITYKSKSYVKNHQFTSSVKKGEQEKNRQVNPKAIF